MFAGVIAGVAGAAMVARYLESQLFGVTPFDIPTYVLAIVVIAVTGMFASWFPARKASASNPLEVIQAQ